MNIKNQLRRVAKIGITEFESTTDVRGLQTDMLRRLERSKIDPGQYACQSAFKFDPPYCLICECYPDSAVGADDPTSANRLSLSAIEARSTAGTVGGSGP